jgi:hypothetical protein
VELYIYSPIRLDGVVLNLFRAGIRYVLYTWPILNEEGKMDGKKARKLLVK